MVLRLGWLPIEYGDKAINDGHGGGVVPLGQYHKAGRALDQRATDVRLPAPLIRSPSWWHLIVTS